MSYIGKNPKVDSVKLDESATVPSGANAEGQLYFNSGTGSISRGLKVFKNSQFVAIDKQLGDADTFHLLKASDLAISEFSAARNSTSTSFLNQNSVPFETTTASGAAGTFSNSSTGDALLTDESADLVFAYKSSGSSDDAQEYFGIPLSIPKAFRGGNVVLSFEYRTGFGTGTTATVDGDFQVGILDKSTGNGGQTTSTNSTTDITAGSAITVASKTGLAVGQRVRLEAGSQSTIGNPDATVVEAFITSVSSTANEITISEDWDTPHASGAVVVSGWLTDVVTGRLPAADSQTDKKGKKFSIQFKTEDDTSDIVLFFQNKNTSSTISRHLFVDNILLSANKFLQASSQTKVGNYWIGQLTSAMSTLSTTMEWNLSTADIKTRGDANTLDNYLSVTNVSSVTRFTALQDCIFDMNGTIPAGTGADDSAAIIHDDGSGTQFLVAYGGQTEHNSHMAAVAGQIAMKKGEFVFLKLVASNGNFTPAGRTAYSGSTPCIFNVAVTPQTSPVVVLESQDEIFTDWNDAGAMVYSQTTTTGSKPSTIECDQVYWRRDGSDMLLKWSFYASSGTGATAGSGDYLFHLPAGYHMDSSRVKYYTTDEGYGDFTTQSSTMIGYGQLQDNGGGAHIRVNLYAYDSNKFRAAGLVTTHATVTRHAYVGSGNGYDFTNMNVMTFEARIPIQGFNAKFNPLLSMPLVDIGSDCEYYNHRFLTNPVNTGTNKSYRLLANTSTGSTIEDTIDKLGTITNSTTEGWSFQASQRVKVHFAVGFACSTTSAGVGIVKLPNSPSTYANEAWGHSQWDDLGVGGTQDTRTGAGYQGATSVSFIMEAGEHIQAIVDNVNIQNSAKSGFTLLVEKDRSNTNMAHIIKPAVCEFSMQLASNTSGGDSTGGAWNQLKPNTFKGETWFLSGFNGTLGVGGTNTDFDLDPGTYSLECTTQVYSAGTAMLKLISGTTVFAYGQTQYTNSTTGDAANASLFTTFTITSKTTFTIKMQTSASQSPNGLGHAAGISGVPETYLAGFIHKLK